jgi:release factor glutamine methyltransferase
MMSEAAARKRLAWQEKVYERNRKRPKQTSLSFYGRPLVVPRDVAGPVPPNYNVLARAVLQEVRKTDTVLDMGTGSGIQAILAASKGAIVTAVDVNPIAVRCARSNVRRNKLSARVSVMEGDLFDRIEGRFDLIIFDPPFRWSAPRDLFEMSCADENYKSLQEFFSMAQQHLSDQGRMLMSFGTSGDLAFFKHLIKMNGFKCKQLLKNSNSGWTYFAFRLTRPGL